MKACYCALVLIGFGLIHGRVSGDDWPQWRGPDRNGISAESGLLKSWPKGGPKLIWQAKSLGTGYSTPAVVGDRIYLVSNTGNDNEFVQALDATQGKQLWSTRIGKVGNPDQQPNYPGARSTPTVDGEFVYAFGSDGDLACLERGSGKIVWQRSVRADLGGKPGIWAYAESPLVDGGAVVCTPGGSEATIVAFNKQTGEPVWKSAMPEGDEAGYASVVIVEVGGLKQYVQFLQKGVVGVDADSGELLWRYDKTATGSLANMPTPVAQDGFVYTAARPGGGLVKLTVNGGKVDTEQVYFSDQLPNSIGGSVEVGGYLYGTNSKGLICADFVTGETMWEDPSVGAGSVCYADGLLYVHGENGDVALVEASPKAYRELGRFTPTDPPDHGKSKTWAYPVVANGRLYIHDFGSLWCYDITAGD